MYFATTSNLHPLFVLVLVLLLLLLLLPLLLPLRSAAISPPLKAAIAWRLMRLLR